MRNKSIYNPAPNKFEAGTGSIGDAVALGAALQYLDQWGIAVRTGHHCAQPILRSYGVEGVVRPTLAVYNTPEDIDTLVQAIRSIR